MATTFVDHTGDGSATKQFTFPSIKEADVKVDVDGVIKSSGTHYNITGYTTTGGGNVVFTSGNIPVSPAAIRIFRDTDVDSPKATYTAGSSIKAADLNANHEQILYAAQEEQNQTILTSDIKDGAITSAKIKDGNVIESKLASDAVTTTKIADNAVTMAKLGSGTLPTDITVASANITDLSVATADIANGAVTTPKLAADAVDGTKIADDAVDSEHIAADSLDTEHYAPTSIDSTALASNSVTESKITDSNVTTDKIANANITLAKLASDLKQTTISDSDTQLPTSGAVVDYVAAQLEPFGGFEAIANELSFPNTQPVSGVAISIADAQGIVVNSSGVSTTGRTLNGTTVTINNIPSNFHSSTIAAGVRFIVTSTGSSQTYNYHKATLPESDLVGLSGDINDFNERYRIGSSNPTSNNDSGDLFFNTGTGKMLVYDGTSSAWEEVQSVGSFFINTISSSSATGGGSATFNNNAYRFTLSNAGTVAEQHIVSINGVIQKPNSGTSQPSEGFAMDGADIIFSAAPSSGADFFIITIGSTVNINTPSAGSVTSSTIASNAVVEAKIADGAVTNNKIASGISASKITGLSTDSITEGDSKVEVVDTGSASHVSTEVDGTLISRAFSGGSTHFKSGVFGAAHNITDGQGQAISLMYGGGTSNQGLIACTHTNGLDIQNSTSVSIGQNGFPNQDYANFTTNGATFFVGGNVKLQVNASGVTTYYSILPNADSTLNLGANATRFANVYADTYYGDGQNLTGVASTVADGCIYENSQTISNNYTISTNKNAMSAGPITIANGVTLTIPSGSVYTIV